MTNHWDKNLNVKKMVLLSKPKFILELGAGSGQNTLQYLSIQKKVGFEMVTISDGDCPVVLSDAPHHTWIKGISFMEIQYLPHLSIDFCSIDTDHNYWTLKRELEELFYGNKISLGGIIVLHDTESFKDSSGIAGEYYCGVPYPEEIHKHKNVPMIKALEEMTGVGTAYKVISSTKESCGATAIQRWRI